MTIVLNSYIVKSAFSSAKRSEKVNKEGSKYLHPRCHPLGLSHIQAKKTTTNTLARINGATTDCHSNEY